GRLPGQGPATLAFRRPGEAEPTDRGFERGRLFRLALVARQSVAGIRFGGGESVQSDLAVPGERCRHERPDQRSREQLQPCLEPGRQMDLFPLRTTLAVSDRESLGTASARAVF